MIGDGRPRARTHPIAPLTSRDEHRQSYLQLPYLTPENIAAWQREIARIDKRLGSRPILAPF
jgi:hypothetical protein